MGTTSLSRVRAGAPGDASARTPQEAPPQELTTGAGAARAVVAAPSPPRRRPQSRPRRGRYRTMAVLLVVVAMAAVALGVRYLLPRSMPLVAVNQGDLAITLRASGTLDATNRVAVSSRIQGRLIELNVAANDIVAEGDVIARIASDDLAAALDAATASWRAAQLATSQAESDLVRARVGRDDASQTLDRQRQLLERGAISNAVYDAASAAFQTAEINVTSATAAVGRAEALEESARASMGGARSALAEATISAPFGGVITATAASPGDVVSPGEDIVELTDPDTLVLIARLDESVIARVHAGSAATLHFGGADSVAIPATLVRVGREVDTETREFTVEVKSTRLPENWAIGQRGIVIIETARARDVLSIPTDLLATRDGRKGVWVVENGGALWRPVTLGEFGGDEVVVLSGLEPDDLLIGRPLEAYSWMPVSAGAPVR